MSIYRHFFEHAPDAVLVVAQDGRIGAVNALAERLFGYLPGELVGQPVEILVPDRLASGHVEQRVRAMAAPWSRPMGAGLRLFGRRKDGSELPVDIMLSLIETLEGRCALAVVRESSESRRVDEELRASSAFRFAILETALDCIICMDHAGRIVEFNHVAERTFGYRRADVLGQSLAESIIPPALREAHRAGLARYLATGKESVLGRRLELTAMRADGSELPIELAITLTPMSDPPLFVGYLRDLTESRRAEEERRRLEAQLQHQQKLESLGALAGGIAHDFNNLLTSILGYADLAMLELPPDAPASHLIGEAMKGARRAAELTKQMLAYSGKGRFVVAPVDLSQLAEEITQLLQISISKKCVIRYELRRDLPAVEADVSQLRQVVMNLIINASEAIGDRGGLIVVSTGVMHCDRAYLEETYHDKSLPEGTYVSLEVTDNGIGMSEETRAKIFEPFFTTKFTGRGLGLAAVLGIIRGHRGAIKCYSEAGKGTTFKVLLPASTLRARQLDEPRFDREMWRGSGTVLVVDDEASVRELSRQMLERMGFTVLTAIDGQAGVALYRTAAERIRLVLLDLTMPRLDGEETFREMRRVRPGVKAILTSGYNEQTATSRFMGKGLAAFIQKPYSFEGLMAVVRKVLASDG